MSKGNNKSKWLTMINWDIKNGVIARWRYDIGTAVLAFFFCFKFYSIYKNSQATTMDLFIYIFCGETKYIPSPQTFFVIPVFYLAIGLYIALMIGDYAKKDFTGIGHQIFLRTPRKLEWWCSKCIWCVITVVKFYLILWAVVILFSILTGKAGSQISESGYYLLMTDMPNGLEEKIKIPLFLLPLLMSIALSLLQMTLSFVFESVGSYAIILAILAISAYWTSTWMIGNYGMLLRNEMFLEEGVKNEIAVGVSIILAIISIIIGYIYVKRKDIF